jgi:hypothetical protein
MFIRLVIFVCMGALAGCAGLPSASVTPGTPERAGVPAQWKLLEGFAALGAVIRTPVPQVVGGAVEIPLSVEKDIQLTAVLTDAASGQEQKNAVLVLHDQDGWKLIVEFPRTGRYALTLFGKLRAASGNSYDALARTEFAATVDPGASMRATPALEAHGISIGAPQPLEVGQQVKFVLSSAEDLEFGSILLDSATNAAVPGGISQIRSGQDWTFTLAFPDTGSYQLVLSARSPSGKASAWETILVARFSATVSAAVAGAPSNWSLSSGARRYGLKVSASTERAAIDEANIVLTTEQELTIAYSLVNRTTGRDAAAMSQPIAFDHRGLEQRIYIAFPDPGEYELALSAKTGAEKEWADLALVRFTATVSAARALIPAPWEVNPYFRKYRMGIVSSPSGAVGDSLAIALEVPEGWQGSAKLTGKSSGKSVTTIAAEQTGGQLRISAVLPRSDEYTLTIDGKIGTDESSRQLARARFTATVDPTLPAFRLWRAGGAWPRLPVAQVKSVSEAWTPIGDYPVYEAYRKGVAAQDFTIASAQGKIPVAKGSPVSFANLGFRDESSVDAVMVALAKDFGVSAYGSTVSFKAGTVVAVSEHGFAAAVAKDAKIPIDGNSLLVPKNSRLVLEDDGIIQIDFAGAPTITVAGKVYACSGTLLIEDYGEQGSAKLVRVMTAKDYTLAIGAASFTLPTGSLLMFRGQRVAQVVFAKDARVKIAGASEAISAGWGFAFDEQGAAEKIQAE